MDTINDNKPAVERGYGYPEEETLDIKLILFRILSNWYWFAISIFFCLFAAYLVNRYSEQVYSVSSSIIVRDNDNSKSFIGAEQLIRSLRLVKNTKSVQNEIGILRSYTLARQAIDELDDFTVTYVAVGRRGIKELKLYNQSPFRVTADSDAVNINNYPIYITILSPKHYLLEIDDGMDIHRKMAFGVPFRNENFSFTVTVRAPELITDEIIGNKYYFYFNNPNTLALIYQSKLSIALNDKKGSILTLALSGYVARQEADYLNKLMEVYIRRGLNEKNRIAENTIKFIDRQLALMTDTLHRAELRLQNFRTKNRVLNITREGAVLFDRIKIVQEDIGRAELKARYYTYLKDYLEKRRDFNSLVAPSAMGVEDPSLSALLGSLSEAHIQREELRISVKPGNPGLDQLNTRIENLRAALNEKVTSLIDANRIILSELHRKAEEIEKSMQQLPVNERLLIGFERDFELIDKMYTYLQEKRAEAAIARASNIPDSRVLDYALAENAVQIKPNPKMNYLNGFVVGVIIPIIIMLLMHFLNNKLYDLKEISRRTTVPVIGTLGHNSYNTGLPTVERPRTTLTESFRALRTNIQYILREPDSKVVAVTSTVVGEGKTFIAANLAAIIAATGKKVLVLGLDLRKPRIHTIFGYSGTQGVSTMLIDQAEFDEIVYTTQIDNLFFAPSGPIPPNPAELLETSRMDDFIRWARERYDIIVVDSPPVAVVSDAILTARFTDANLFVVRYAYSSKEVLNLINDIYKHQDIRNLGLVINDYNPRKGYGHSYSYAYSYGYSYGYGYGGYYGNTYGNDYYSDEEPPLTWRERLRRLF